MSLMGGLDHSKVAIAEWARFCADVVEDDERIRSPLTLGGLIQLTREDALEIMSKRMQERVVIEKEDKGRAKL